MPARAPGPCRGPCAGSSPGDPARRSHHSGKVEASPGESGPASPVFGHRLRPLAIVTDPGRGAARVAKAVTVADSAQADTDSESDDQPEG
jgi:hypothetical protein